MYHPTVMMRRDWIARTGQRYDPAFAHAEDYDFWVRAARVTRFANLPVPLVGYRRHAGQVTEAHAAAQAAHSAEIHRRVLRDLGVHPSPDELQLHGDVARAACGTSAERLEAGRCWLERLRDANASSGRYGEPAFSQALATYWYRTCVESVLRGGAPTAFARSPLAAALPHAGRRRVALHLMRLVPASPGHRAARGVKRILARWSRGCT
jgi:hypothetical protein